MSSTGDANQFPLILLSYRIDTWIITAAHKSVAAVCCGVGHVKTFAIRGKVLAGCCTECVRRTWITNRMS